MGINALIIIVCNVYQEYEKEIKKDHNNWKARLMKSYINLYLEKETTICYA